MPVIQISWMEAADPDRHSFLLLLMKFGCPVNHRLKDGFSRFFNQAMNSIRANIGLLASIASDAGHEYTDAYAVWEMVCQHDDAYLIVDTVLWIAKRQQIHVLEALELYKGVEDIFG